MTGARVADERWGRVLADERLLPPCASRPRQILTSPSPATAKESRVISLYEGRSVFITGATGFIGKALVEKLMRSCTGIERVYLLIRPKGGLTASDRLKELLASDIFEQIKRQENGLELLQEKLIPVEGDISQPSFGISEEQMGALKASVSVVFNSAATVRFSEPIENATRSNVYSVKQLFNFCDQLERLEAIVHLSTAFSNCNRGQEQTIEELFYEPPMQPSRLMAALRSLHQITSDIKLNSRPLEPTTQGAGASNHPTNNHEPEAPEAGGSRVDKTEQVGVGAASPNKLSEAFTAFAIERSHYPNTYTFSKAVSEACLLEEARARSGRYQGPGGIPIAVVRPSIVGAAWQEPEPGFVDNATGPTAAIVNFYTGGLQFMPGKDEGVADFVPVDFLVNFLILSGWFLLEARAQQRGERPTTSGIEPAQEGVYVFNYISGARNPMRWGLLTRSVAKLVKQFPSKSIVRIPNPHFIESRYWWEVSDFWNQKMVCYAMDIWHKQILCLPVWPGRTHLAAYERLRKLTDALAHFTTHEWNWSDGNVQKLQSQLSELDASLFPSDIRKVSWPQWMENYVIGARLFMLKEDASQLSAARSQLNKRLVVYRSCVLILVALVSWFFFNALLMSVDTVFPL